MVTSLATIACRAQVGLHAPLVHVEVSLSCGLPTFSIVGLPATVVRESKDRVRAALTHCGFEFPAGRITVNLAPADLPKQGGRFDLPIALGILLASEQVRVPAAAEPAASGHSASPNLIAPHCEFYGELGLSGELKHVRGLLLAAAHASRDGHEMIVPRANAEEVYMVAKTPVRAADHLLDVCAYLEGKKPLPEVRGTPRTGPRSRPTRHLNATAPDLLDVRGQLQAKRALLIAAAGAHSLLMIGPPGSGKSMLAQRLPGLLPPLTEDEALEVASIASVSAAGFTPGTFGRRPFRSPHHTASAAALVGGGSRARPGEISLAHHGVLFLDELPEFARSVLEALREPLETGVVSVSRAALQTQYPAAFQLIAAMNPCPCGRLGDPTGNCRCSPAEIQHYRTRISAPLLDRIDMHVEVPRVPISEFEERVESAARRAEECTTTAEASARVTAARKVQLARQGLWNARLPDAAIDHFCAPDFGGRRVLEAAMTRMGFSARARQRILKLARTIADLEGEATITAQHIGEAVLLRTLDRGSVAPGEPLLLASSR
jgi:magnesium chelatase family protein